MAAKKQKGRAVPPKTKGEKGSRPSGSATAKRVGSQEPKAPVGGGLHKAASTVGRNAACVQCDCPAARAIAAADPGKRNESLKCWVGYYQHLRCAANPTDKGARLCTAWRGQEQTQTCCKAQLWKWVQDVGLTCFWRAACLALPSTTAAAGQFEALVKDWLAAGKVKEGVKPAEACVYCDALGLSYAQHEANGHIECARGDPKGRFGCVAYVLYGDRGEVAGHYLPVACLREGTYFPSAETLRCYERELKAAVAKEKKQAGVKGAEEIRAKGKERALAPANIFEVLDDEVPGDHEEDWMAPVGEPSTSSTTVHAPPPSPGAASTQKPATPSGAGKGKKPQVEKPKLPGPAVQVEQKGAKPGDAPAQKPKPLVEEPKLPDPTVKVEQKAAEPGGAPTPKPKLPDPAGGVEVEPAKAKPKDAVPEAADQAGPVPPPQARGGAAEAAAPAPAPIAEAGPAGGAAEGPNAEAAEGVEVTIPRWLPCAFGTNPPPVLERGPLGLSCRWYGGETSDGLPTCQRSEASPLGTLWFTIPIVFTGGFLNCLYREVSSWRPKPAPTRVVEITQCALLGVPTRAGRLQVRPAEVLRDVGLAPGLMLRAIARAAWTVTRASLHSAFERPKATGRVAGIVRHLSSAVAPFVKSLYWARKISPFVALIGGALALGAIVPRLLRRAGAVVYPRYVEARASILETTPIGAGDLLYVLDREPQVGERRALCGGSFNLKEMVGVEIHGLHHLLSEPKTVQERGFTWTVRVVLNAETSLLESSPWQRGKVTARYFRAEQPSELRLRTLGGLPTAEAKVRLLYQAFRRILPESLQGPLLEQRALHLGSEAPEELEPAAVAAALCQVDLAVRAHNENVQAFAVRKTRHPRNCVSCGIPPPNGRYRWKHRICSACAQSLKACGHVTEAGAQVQDNLQVPTCYPGLVYVSGDQLPPPEKKWARVACHGLTPEGQREKRSRVQVAQGRVDVPRLKGERARRWVDVEPTDLAKLRKPVPFKPLFALAGIACSGARPMVSAPTDHNRLKALLGRVFQEPPEHEWGLGPRPGTWDVAHKFRAEILPDLEAEPMSVKAWLRSMPQRRRRVLEQAAKHYEEGGLRASDAYFTGFVKSEFLPFFSQQRLNAIAVEECLVELREMLDRFINGPAEKTHIVAGRRMKPMIQRLKHHWDKYSPLVYGSAGPEVLDTLLQRLAELDGTYFCCDFSLFDRTHSEESWRFVESFYDRTDSDFRQVLDWWRAPAGTCGPFKYRGFVMNASGRDDTALANAVLNGFATTLSAAAAFYGVALGELSLEQLREFRAQSILSVCGDDSLGVLPKLSRERLAEFRERFNANIAAFGFVAKLQVMDSLQDVLYLGMRPYWVAGRWTWGKTIGRATYKMGWVLEPHKRDVMAHITGVADMHRLCSLHVPVLSDLALKIVELRQGAKRTPVVRDPNRPWEWTQQGSLPYDRDTLSVTAEVYTKLSGTLVTVADFEDLILQIRKISSLPCVLDHWLWRLIVASDEL